jgi:hypothetical protein
VAVESAIIPLALCQHPSMLRTNHTADWTRTSANRICITCSDGRSKAVLVSLHSSSLQVVIDLASRRWEIQYQRFTGLPTLPVAAQGLELKFIAAAPWLPPVCKIQ